MAYAILRVEKITTHTGATSRTQHNYRTQETPNADAEQFDRNVEFINKDRRNYWDLAAERIAELELTRLRKDAVRAVELVLTGSPEAFQRDAAGRADDVKDSPWMKDNLHFLRQRFGERNLIGCVLHQDEVTPHIHAVVVPVTEDGRLSARDVFGPSRLRELQTAYAKCMEPYGMERGIKGSTALHEDVRRHHNAQQMTKEQLAEVAAPHEPKPYTMSEFKLWDLRNPQAWMAREQERINAYLAEQVAVANAKLTQVATVAAANTLERERAKVMEKRLATSHKSHEKTQDELGRTQQQLAGKKQELATQQASYTRLLVQIVQKEQLAPEIRQQAVQVRRDSHQRAQQIATEVLAQPFKQTQQLTDGLQKQGFTVQKLADEQLVVRDGQTGALFALSELRPDGQELVDAIKQAIERTKQDEEQARRRELAQAPGSIPVVITARDEAQAGRIQEALEKSGANVWQVQALPDQRVELRISYQFDWKTIEGISQVLDKVENTKGVTLQEVPGAQHSRTYAAWRMAQERTDRGRPDQGIEM